jgi:hypothetical protein
LDLTHLSPLHCFDLFFYYLLHAGTNGLTKSGTLTHHQINHNTFFKFSVSTFFYCLLHGGTKGLTAESKGHDWLWLPIYYLSQNLLFSHYILPPSTVAYFQLKVLHLHLSIPWPHTPHLPYLTILYLTATFQLTLFIKGDILLHLIYSYDPKPS